MSPGCLAIVMDAMRPTTPGAPPSRAAFCFGLHGPKFNTSPSASPWNASC